MDKKHHNHSAALKHNNNSNTKAISFDTESDIGKI